MAGFVFRKIDRPVFRSFQAEMENILKNTICIRIITPISEFLMSHLYKGHPYERDIIGFPEHLKNPRLSKLIEFYDTWYVPSNMALILTGNFDIEEAKPLIEQKFGRLIDKQVPERPSYPSADFTGNPKYSAKLGYSPMVIWGYKTVPVGHPDEIILGFCASLLSNSMSTGLLDKITMDGDVQQAAATLDSRRDEGRFLIQAIPYYDANQRRYESDKATERTVMNEVDKLKKGNIEDWLIESVKNSELRSYEMMLENPSSKIVLLNQILYISYHRIIMRPYRINGKIVKDIQRVAQKYLNEDHLMVSIDIGTPKRIN